MFKKSIQNIMLVISILVSVILVYQIWFSSYFLPVGEETFFSSLGRNILNPIISLFEGRDDADFSENLHKLYQPDKIVLNSTGSRLVFAADAKEYAELHSLTDSVMKDSMLGNYALKSRETVDLDSFLAVLKGKSVYVDFGRDCDYRLFSYAICGEEKNQFSENVSTMRGYVISLQDGILNDISLFIRDTKSGNVYRYVVEADKSELTEQVEAYMAEGVSGIASYSFELNFHKEQETAVSKVLFDPMLLLDLAPTQMVEVQAVEEARIEQLQSGDSAEAILDAFSINNRTLRKYTDLNGARVFVENNATLTVYPDGLLVYQTVPGGRGLDITGGADKTNYDIYEATADSVEFVEGVCNQLYPAMFDELEISSDLVSNEDTPGYYRIFFDYTIGGVPIRQKTADGYGHAVEIEIENGYLKSYRQLIRHYEKGEQQRQLTPMLQVADLLVDAMYTGENPLMIRSIAPCYIENEEGDMKFAWRAIVDGKEVVLE